MGLLTLQVIVSQTFPLELTNTFSLSQLNFSNPQTGQSPLERNRGRPPLTGDRRPTGFKYSIWITLVELVLSVETQTDPYFFNF